MSLISETAAFYANGGNLAKVDFVSFKILSCSLAAVD